MIAERAAIKRQCLASSCRNDVLIADREYRTLLNDNWIRPHSDRGPGEFDETFLEGHAGRCMAALDADYRACHGGVGAEVVTGCERGIIAFCPNGSRSGAICIELHLVAAKSQVPSPMPFAPGDCTSLGRVYIPVFDSRVRLRKESRHGQRDRDECYGTLHL